MTPLAIAISRALIHFVWQGLLVGMLLTVVLFALRKHRPTSRYLAGCIALGLLALMPVATTWILYSGSSGVTPAPNTALQALTVNDAFHAFACGLDASSLGHCRFGRWACFCFPFAWYLATTTFFDFAAGRNRRERRPLMLWNG
jgi:hypothetical protein